MRRKPRSQLQGILSITASPTGNMERIFLFIMNEKKSKINPGSFQDPLHVSYL